MSNHQARARVDGRLIRCVELRHRRFEDVRRFLDQLVQSFSRCSHDFSFSSRIVFPRLIYCVVTGSIVSNSFRYLEAPFRQGTTDGAPARVADQLGSLLDPQTSLTKRRTVGLPEVPGFLVHESSPEPGPMTLASAKET